MSNHSDSVSCFKIINILHIVGILLSIWAGKSGLGRVFRIRHPQLLCQFLNKRRRRCWQSKPTTPSLRRLSIRINNPVNLARSFFSLLKHEKTRKKNLLIFSGTRKKLRLEPGGIYLICTSSGFILLSLNGWGKKKNNKNPNIWKINFPFYYYYYYATDM